MRPYDGRRPRTQRLKTSSAASTGRALRSNASTRRDEQRTDISIRWEAQNDQKDKSMPVTGPVAIRNLSDTCRAGPLRYLQLTNESSDIVEASLPKAGASPAKCCPAQSQRRRTGLTRHARVGEDSDGVRKVSALLRGGWRTRRRRGVAVRAARYSDCGREYVCRPTVVEIYHGLTAGAIASLWSRVESRRRLKSQDGAGSGPDDERRPHCARFGAQDKASAGDGRYKLPARRFHLAGEHDRRESSISSSPRSSARQTR